MSTPHKFTTSTAAPTTISSSTAITSTEAPTTTTLATTTTVIPHCNGAGPFVKQDISVVYELSTARAAVDKKIADFISDALFPTKYYELPGDYGTPITQILVAPFPNTSYYANMGVVPTGYDKIRDLSTLSGLLKAQATFDNMAQNNFSGDYLVDGLTFIGDTKIQNSRSDVKETVIIIASSDAGIANAKSVANILQNTSTIVTISVGDDAETLGLLATDGFAFNASNIDDDASELGSEIAAKLLLQSAYCPTVPTTLPHTTTVSPTTSPTISTSTTPPTPTPLTCVGSGPYIKQDISVLYELSTARATVDKKIADFINDALFPSKYYELPGDYGTPVTQILVAPFPNTSYYAKMGVVLTDYDKIRDLSTLSGLLQAQATFDNMAQNNFSSDNLVDGLTFIEDTTIQNSRPDVQKTVIIIASSDAGVASAKSVAQKLQNTSTIVTVSVGDDADTLGSLATGGFAFNISNFDDDASELAYEIATKLLFQSAYCPTVPTTLPHTTTVSPTTSPTISTSTTSPTPTPLTCDGSGPYVKQDINVVYELSTDKAAVDRSIVTFMSSSLFPSTVYQLPEQSTVPVTQLLVAPFPNSVNYSSLGVIKTDYSELRDLNTLKGILSASVQIDNLLNFTGNAIIDALNFYQTTTLKGSRPDVKKTFIIIASTDAGVVDALKSAQALGKQANIVTIAVGKNTSTLKLLATEGFAYAVDNLTSATQITALVNDISAKLLGQSGYCIDRPTTHVVTSPSPSPSIKTTSTTAPFTTTTSSSCNDVSPYIKQDISVVYELSTARATVDKKIADFISDALFPKQYYELPGAYGTPVTQILVAPFPNTSYYANMGVVPTDYDKIRDLSTLSGLLKAQATFDNMAQNNFSSDNLVDGLSFFEDTRFTSSRPEVNKTLIIIASSDAGVPQAVSAAEKWRATHTIITVAVGGNAKTLASLATKGFALQIPDLDNASDKTALVTEIYSKLRTLC